MSLTRYIIKRIFTLIPVVIGVVIFAFFMSRIMPGDPVLAYLQGVPDPDIYQQLKHELWLDRPILMQFAKYVKDTFTGNWGYSVSINHGQEVWTLIMERFPRTIDITFFSLIIAIYFGIKTGTISATKRNRPHDTLFRILSLIGVSMPVFFLGILFQFLFSNLIPIFPATGFKDMRYSNPPFITGFRIIDALITGEVYLITDYLFHLVLPVFCLTFVTVAGITRQSRSSMLEVLGQDYIRTARAKGCYEKDIIRGHALKNSLMPTVTVIGLNFASLLAGTVLIEVTFNLKGIGKLFVDAILSYDYWVINALILVIAILFVLINLITDIVYAILDPRIKY